ncbi:MAG: dihydrolipoyllysine-residue succinyltransferase [Thiobacillus sp.]|nr:dihydrolipoyllysine-residue succinyltransferase [Thiobacillus sp.]
MLVQVKTPELSESVQSGTLLEWRKQVGDTVTRDEILADLETDKVILEVPAPSAGVLAAIAVPNGGEVKAGDVLAEIETEAGEVVVQVAVVAAPEVAPSPLAPPPGGDGDVPPSPAGTSPEGAGRHEVAVPSEARDEPQAHRGGGGEGATSPIPPSYPPTRADRRVPMSRLRERIAERMVEAQRTAAILTTFNEVDMQPVQELRKRVQAEFQAQHGIKLGLMSFFVAAACRALKQYPILNASVDGRDIVYHDCYDVGMAVSSERGLVVPVIRDADTLGLAEIEQKIADFARRANSLELKLEELEGGTFTITNGGVFGSMLSTPILNPPQSGVLGLHRIQDRPMAVAGQVVIRPMMYLALSYDHRIVDGREAVSFLKSVKDALENPDSLLGPA